MSKVLTFGEIMLRLQPEGYKRFLQSNKLDMSFAGAEANVAVSLANYGTDVKYVTKLPNNIIGYSAKNSLRTFGVVKVPKNGHFSKHLLLTCVVPRAAQGSRGRW